MKKIVILQQNLYEIKKKLFTFILRKIFRIPFGQKASLPANIIKYILFPIMSIRYSDSSIVDICYDRNAVKIFGVYYDFNIFQTISRHKFICGNTLFLLKVREEFDDKWAHEITEVTLG